MKKIGYVSSVNPFSDRKAWSGLIYKIREAIELAGYEVVWIPYNLMYKNNTWQYKLNDRYWNLRHKIFHKDILGEVHSAFNARRYAQSINLEKVEECDYLFFPGGAQISLFLETSIPVIYLADATIHKMLNYYWFNIDKAAFRIAKSLEEKASQKSFINIRASQWANDSVINDCKCDKSRCFVLEFGANIDSKDITSNNTWESGRLNVLFSGVDWERKGGDIAVKTVDFLRTKGLDAHLLIVGIKELPSRYKSIDYIDHWGFLNKNNSEEYEKYIQAYKQSHIFLLPTKAECAGVVFSEAAGFGLPCYTFATGGTTNYVISDYNGFAFPMGCTPEAFANRIYNDIIQGKIQHYHVNALALFKDKLSWDAWATRFKRIMESEV